MGEILVALDGSKHSNKVIDCAVDLAKKTSSSILLLYVMPDQVIPAAYRDYARIEGLDTSAYYETVANKIMIDMSEKIRGKGIKYESVYHVGSPSRKIAEMARLRKVDMIVVGLTGLHGIGRVRALGSTARRVVEESRVPVVVVP